MLILSRYIENFNENQFIEKYAKRNGITKTEARKKILSEEPKESYFQQRIIKGIRKAYPEAFVIKITLGMYSQAGFPDVLVILNGRYYGIEVKRPVGSRVSELQERCIKSIRNAGGVASVCRWPEEAIKMIEDNEKRKGDA